MAKTKTTPTTKTWKDSDVREWLRLNKKEWDIREKDRSNMNLEEMRKLDHDADFWSKEQKLLEKRLGIKGKKLNDEFQKDLDRLSKN